MKMSSRRKATFIEVLKRIAPYKIRVALSILLSAACVALTLYVPVLVGRAIDAIVGKGNVDFDVILPILLRTGIVALSAAVLQWTAGTVNNTVAYKVVHDLRKEAFNNICRLPLRYLDMRPTGDLVSRVTADADAVADGLLLGFSRLFTGVATVVGTLIFMLSLSPLIAVAVAVVTPASLFAARFISTHTYRYFNLQAITRSEQTSLIDEMIGGHFTVKAFSMEEQNCERFDEINERLKKTSLRAIFFSSLTNPVTRFVNSIVYALVALLGGIMCINSLADPSAAVFTVGTLAAFLAYANQYTKPFNEISGVITELQNAFACAARLFELCEEPPEPSDKEMPSLKKAEGNIELCDIGFSYEAGKKLIEDLSLSVKAGQRVAIVGPTGCGKTTLINLLMRFYDAESGEIDVDGRNIQSVNRASLRENYGMVLQDTWLKNCSVRENIAMGKKDATFDEIVAAAKAAHADSFIRRLPQGYDTVLGEDGGSLSQGQKQLLCISRVMLALPPMLILDEATSSIDTRTEIKIQDAFAQLMKGRTSFIVAHRLSTIKEADVILVMRDGRIVERGKHDELLSQNGFYAKLYNSQFEN